MTYSAMLEHTLKCELFCTFSHDQNTIALYDQARLARPLGSLVLDFVKDDSGNLWFLQVTTCPQCFPVASDYTVRIFFVAPYFSNTKLILLVHHKLSVSAPFSLIAHLGVMTFFVTAL
jgi:hypothetical protein